MLRSERVRTGCGSQADATRGAKGWTSLRGALESLSPDRATETAVREILSLMRRRMGETFTARKLSSTLELDHLLVEKVLEALSDGFVLDSDDDSPGYVYRGDRLLELEIDRFMRRADSHAGLLQTNVEKFRHRYGER